MQGQDAKYPKPAGSSTHTKGGRPRSSGRSNMEKVELESLLARRLKGRKLQDQYVSGMSATLANLKGWTKTHDDTKAIDISSYLRTWAAERVYAKGEQRICADDLLAMDAAPMQESCQTSDGGGIPNCAADGIGLSPLQTTPAIKSSDVTVADTTVSEIKQNPEPLDL